MYFISILIVLAIVQFWDPWQMFQKDAWYYRWQSFAISQTEKTLFAFIFSVLFPCVLLILCHAILIYADRWFFSLLDFVITVVVLLYSLGRGDYNVNAKAYCTAWEAGDYQQLPKIVERIDEDYRVGENESLQVTHVCARESFVYLGFTRFFVVIFWFSLLGPVAALCYRLTLLFNATQDIEVAKNVRIIMEWPAGRLLSITFALMGDFASGITSLLSTLFNLGMTTKQVVHANALAALNLDMGWLDGKFSEIYPLTVQTAKAPDEIRAIKEIMKRSLVFAVIVIAIIEIIK